jgi:hypothetical protein
MDGIISCSYVSDTGICPLGRLSRRGLAEGSFFLSLWLINMTVVGRRRFLPARLFYVVRLLPLL